MKLVIRVNDDVYTYDNDNKKFPGHSVYEQYFNWVIDTTETWQGDGLQRLVNIANTQGFTIVEYVPAIQPEGAVY